MAGVNFRLDGKLALVTGARRGIGRAIALALAGAGADIIGVSATMEPDGGAIGAEVRDLGRSFTGFTLDFAKRADVVSFAEGIAQDGIDILVNNAGDISRSPAVAASLREWDRIIEVDLSSHFVLTQSAGRAMIERGGGKILFTASLLSFQGGVLVASYAAAKSGIAGLVRALSNEWAAHGVTVNGIAPGYIETDVTTALREDRARSAAILDRIPAGRWGVPADIGGAAVFLASPAADYVSGVVLPVDGGWLGR